MSNLYIPKHFWKWGQTLSLVFDISFQSKLKWRSKRRNKIGKSMLINIRYSNTIAVVIIMISLMKWVWEAISKMTVILRHKGELLFEEKRIMKKSKMGVNFFPAISLACWFEKEPLFLAQTHSRRWKATEIGKNEGRDGVWKSKWEIL